MIRKAVAKTGLQERGSASFRPALEKFVSEYNRSSTVTSEGDTTNEHYVLEALGARFAIEEWIVRHPEVLEKEVERPLFILGLPRAGTTVLLNLLRHDPARRVYWHWEGHREVPPARACHFQDDPRVARRTAEVEAGIASGAIDLRHHVEMGDEPTECFWALGQDFKSYIWMTRTQVPDYFHWLLRDADMEAAYRHHKHALQVMQSQAPGRWTLKFPTHAVAIDALLRVYPDARIIVTHRDPSKPVGSSCSSVRHVLALNNHSVDMNYLGYETATLQSESVKRVAAARGAHPEVPFYDFHYHRFIIDPIAEVQRIYNFLGETLTASAEAAMHDELVRQEQRRKIAGEHRYRLEDYGLSHASLDAMFGDYMDRYGIARERD